MFQTVFCFSSESLFKEITSIIFEFLSSRGVSLGLNKESINDLFIAKLFFPNFNFTPHTTDGTISKCLFHFDILGEETLNNMAVILSFLSENNITLSSASETRTDSIIYEILVGALDPSVPTEHIDKMLEILCFIFGKDFLAEKINYISKKNENSIARHLQCVSLAMKNMMSLLKG